MATQVAKEPRELTELEKARALVAKADAEAEAARPVCGHKNEHWTGDDPMTCTLKRGHGGNHKAEYTLRSGAKEIAQWKNAAGVPVDQIEPEPLPEEE